MGAFRVVPVAVMLLVVPVVAALPVSTSDHGIILNASDDRDNPTLLSDTGSYLGVLPPGDKDWYRLDRDAGGIPSGHGACLALTVQGPANAKVILESYRGFSDDLVANLTPDQTVKLGVAMPSFIGASFGLEPVDGKRSAGVYDFDIDVHTLSDPPSSEVNGPSAAPCLAIGLGGGDKVVQYMDIQEGATVTLSISNGTHKAVELVDPDGDARLSLGQGEGLADQIRVDTSGLWSLTMENVGQGHASYLVGLSIAEDCHALCFLETFSGPDDDDDDDDRGGNHCRPSCL